MMGELKVLKDKLAKINQLLDKLDERLATGEIGEAKYKELVEKYKAEAESLKNQIAEKELIEEVGLKAEEKREIAKEEPVKEEHEDSEDTLVYNLRRLLTEGGYGNYLVASVGDVYVQFAANRGEQQIYCEAVSNQFLPPGMRLNEDKISQLRRLGFEIGRDSPNFSRTFYIVDSQELREIARTALSVLSNVYGITPRSRLQFELNLESGEGRDYRTPARPVYQGRKNATLAAVLSFFIIGVGQIYCGRVKRGVAILGLSFLFWIIFFASVAASSPYGGPPAFGILMFFVLLVFWLWNISDAFNLAKKINRGEA